MNPKRYIALKLDKKDSCIKDLLMFLNNVIFHFDERYHRKDFGRNNPDISFYVIRPSGTDEGLLSLFFTAMRQVIFAEENGMIPVVDFKNYKTQYTSEMEGLKCQNVWTYYFTQVSQYSLDEVYSSKNVYLSGWGRPDVCNNIFMNDYNEEINKKRNEFIYKHTSIQTNIIEKVKKYANENFCTEKLLGVYVRGTDYIKLRPKGHPIQPTLEDVMKKVDEFVAKYDIELIFLVTEDYDIYQQFETRYSGKIISSDSMYIKDYQNDYIANSITEEPYNRGLNYLIKMLLLNECPYIVTTLTNGSLFSLALRENKPKDAHIFNLGKY